ncbi:YDG/SRA domain-containing protein [Kocuria rosea]|uniref:YDG/SRA domain-containing protein n=1 Tax=Kocuria rosea TaxID=1275 RepID=UPI002B252B1C|nr:YDG/SRA domain-containing protein [Kocuria rosea]MEB2527410.1 YDG/SRA domain-containing protein [Kocuria rosea]MEB2617557.1 YDG/SRA domain-containing protein [Kocuria rosea]
MADLVFGQIPGVYPGRTFSARAELRAAGVHMPPMHGIQGNPEDGADSIVLSGGYPDDEDLGDVIIFTGAGGQHRLKRIQLKDQSFSARWNAALVRSHLDARPVRVTSGNGKTKISPDKYVYRGLYLVDDYWYKVGAEGFRMCRFKLVKTDDGSPLDIISNDRSIPPPGTSNPERSKTFIDSIGRSTAVTAWVKKIYDGTCQFCRTKVALPGGIHYSEGTHVRPLGYPHNGSDTADNMLCLCPTCHVRFSHLALYLDDNLQLHDLTSSQADHAVQILARPFHDLDLDAIAYHRRLAGA